MKTIFVVGAGKGVGNHVAAVFGKKGFRVILMARNEEHLREYQQEFASQQIETEILTIDVADEKSVEETLTEAKVRYGTPDVFFYNVGVTIADEKAGKVDRQLLMNRFGVDVAAAYQCIQLIADNAFVAKKGAILLTGGGIAFHPHAAYLPLSLDKAAMRAMVLALHEEYKEKGIFLGTVQICGSVIPGTGMDPGLIAQAYWELYEKQDNFETLFRP